MIDLQFKTRPFPHQLEIFERTKDLLVHGFFMEMGTGKTKVAIDTAAHMFVNSAIDAVFVVAPNTIQRNWITVEIPAHCPGECASIGLDWHSSRKKSREQRAAVDRLIDGHAWNEVPRLGRRLRWLAMAYDAIITPDGRAMARRFCDAFPRFLFVADESTRVKNPTSERGKMALAIAKSTPLRRVLTGTPVSNGPFDVYQQIRILDDRFWWRHGLDSVAAFQSRFGIFREIEITSGSARRGAPASRATKQEDPGTDAASVSAFEQLDLSTLAAIAELQQGSVDVAVDKLVKLPTARRVKILAGYKDVEQIHAMIAPITTRITKEDAGLNLPPKLYNKIVFELTPSQRQAYDTLRATYMLELASGELITATIAMVRLLRLQQIACGYLPNPDPEGEPIIMPDVANEPRLLTLLELLEDVPHKAIVWARFRVDIDRICSALGDRCVRVDGSISNPSARASAIERFRDPKGAQFFVANPAAIGMGITLNEASTVIYYSNSFSLEQREQSEDRCHRIGQTKSVLYYDIIADRTVDERVVDALREKKRLAALVTGDKYREWLE